MMKKEVFSLWQSDIPGYIPGGEKPTLTYYPSSCKTSNAAVIICPGGGYRIRSDYEGRDYALFLNSLGIDAFVLDYRVAPTRFPYPLMDARRAIRLVRYNAERFGVDKNKIAVMGSSAGGHLSALLCTYRQPIEEEGQDGIDNEDYLPNGQILCYPVIDPDGHRDSFDKLLDDRFDSLWQSVTPSLIADGGTPPAFIWHTSSDPSVNVINTYKYAGKLRELDVPVEMHIFPIGGHGLGLADEDKRELPYVAEWSALLTNWLRLYGFIV